MGFFFAWDLPATVTGAYSRATGESALLRVRRTTYSGDGETQGRPDRGLPEGNNAYEGVRPSPT